MTDERKHSNLKGSLKKLKLSQRSLHTDIKITYVVNEPINSIENIKEINDLIQVLARQAAREYYKLSVKGEP